MGGWSEIVDRVKGEVGTQLHDALPELNEAVRGASGEGSFTVTLQVKRGKKGRFTATLKARVRAPREPVEIDMHLDESGQLSLGYDEARHAPAGDESTAH